MCLLLPHHRGAMSQVLTCCMRSQSHERSWPSLLKLKFEMVNCGSSCKKLNSGFQFQFQFQGFQFQFHFQFHQFQFQFQFQFRNWNWNWPAIPIPELNWPQPCQVILFLVLTTKHSTCQDHLCLVNNTADDCQWNLQQARLLLGQHRCVGKCLFHNKWKGHNLSFQTILTLHIHTCTGDKLWALAFHFIKHAVGIVTRRQDECQTMPALFHHYISVQLNSMLPIVMHWTGLELAWLKWITFYFRFLESQ